jgi:hypothetical protein
MNVETSIQKVEMTKWPSKLVTVLIAIGGVVLLYFNGAVAASLTQTNVGLSKALPIVFLIVAVGLPVVVARQSLRSRGSRWAATRRAALASSAMNIAVLPYALLVLSL